MISAAESPVPNPSVRRTGVLEARRPLLAPYHWWTSFCSVAEYGWLGDEAGGANWRDPPVAVPRMTSHTRNSIDLAFPRDAGDQVGRLAWMNSSMVFAEIRFAFQLDGEHGGREQGKPRARGIELTSCVRGSVSTGGCRGFRETANRKTGARETVAGFR
jgi:hypothetical protein